MSESMNGFERLIATDGDRRALRDPATLFPYPGSLPGAAMHGLAGDIVRAIEPHTEADPAALLFQFLVAFGNSIGRSAYVPIEADRHHANLFCLVVGRSSKGRKGTSWGQVRRLFEQIDPDWIKQRVVNGASSGEGIIYAVRDARDRQDADGDDEDPGASDKRLNLIETEFANVLQQGNREGNVLSPTLRNAWDSGTLRTLTRKAPLKATDAHISVIGHIVQDELVRLLKRTEIANGFANRFIFVCSQRSKRLAHGGRIEDVDLSSEMGRLREAVLFGKQAQRLDFAPDAIGAWRDAYDLLADEQPGLLGALEARAEPMVLRLALIFALLDRQVAIQPQHILAGLSAWSYARDSVRHLFGASTGDPVADATLRSIRERGGQVTRSELSADLGHNVAKVRIDAAVLLLERLSLIGCRTDSTGGRPAAWLYSRAYERNELSGAAIGEAG